MNMEMEKILHKPRFLIYLIFLVFLLPIWVAILEFAFRPKILNSATSRVLLSWYILPPIFLVGGAYVLVKLHHGSKVSAIQSQRVADQLAASTALERQKKESASRAAADLSREAYTLEVF